MSLANDLSDERFSGNAETGAPEGSLRDYFDLLKPRVMSLVIFTAVVGMVAAPGALHPVLAVIAIVCIAIGAGASGALNMWYDADIDRIMKRTVKRPIPAGRVDRDEVLGFGIVLSTLSVLVLGVTVNWLASALLAFTIFFYVVIYTMWLKRWTPQNIVIGGAAGALPPVIAWAAVTGGTALEPWLLFAIIFIWTPPHFWSLALLTQGDYARAQVPMLPVVAGEGATRRQIVAYAALLLPLGASPWFFGYASTAYGVAALALGGYFLISTVRLLRSTPNTEDARKAALRTFLASLIYLFVLFSAVLADAVASRLNVW